MPVDREEARSAATRRYEIGVLIGPCSEAESEALIWKGGKR